MWTLLFAISPSWTSSDREEVSDVLGWYPAFSLYGRVLTWICRCRYELCLPTTVFWTHVVISLHTIMLVFNAVLPERSTIMGIQRWFWALSLTCRDLSGFSESLYDIMDCSKFFATLHWEMLFLNFRLFAHAVLPKWWTSPYSYLWTSFEDAPFIPSHDRITCYQSTRLPVECWTQVFCFPVFWCPCPNFLERVGVFKFRMSVQNLQNKGHKGFAVMRRHAMPIK